MKRAVWLTLAILALGFLVFYLRSWAPFMGIYGTSMEPEFKVGDLVLVEHISSGEVKEGDVIVFEIPTLVRESYNYPQSVAHRVTKVISKNDGVIFKTKGDNTGEDPFVVRPVDLRGKVGKKIPYLGFFLLFPQSKQGLVSIAVIILLIGFGSYSSEIKHFKKRIQREILSPVLEEQGETKQDLRRFTSAMAEYGEHLKSHTKVVKDLAETTGRLSEVVEKLDKKLSKKTTKKKRRTRRK